MSAFAFYRWLAGSAPLADLCKHWLEYRSNSQLGKVVPDYRITRKVVIQAKLVVGEGAAPSRHANLAFSGVYKTPPHGWCYAPFCRVV